MEARDAEVEQHEVGRALARPGGEELGEPRVHQLDAVAEAGEAGAGGLHDGGVGVDAHQGEPGPALEERLRVPGLPEGGVDHQPAVGGRHQQLEALGEQDRLVHDHSTILPPSSSAASLNRPSFSSRYAFHAGSAQTSMYFFRPRIGPWCAAGPGVDGDPHAWR